MDFSAIVLAGGQGTRLQSVVADRPKVLAPVDGRPFLTYLLDQLQNAGVRRVVLSTGYLAERFADEIGGAYRQLEILYAHEESPLGTGGAIKFAGKFVDAANLLVMNGDSYFDADLKAYLNWHERGGQDASLLLVRVSDASRFGTVLVSSDDRVEAFLEKRPDAELGMINAGVYVLRREMLTHIPDGKCSIERDVFPRWIKEFDVRGFASEGEFLDIGVPEDYQRSHDFMARVTK